MSKIAKRVLIVVGAVMLLLVALAFMARAGMQPGKGSVLEMAIEGEIPEEIPPDALAQILGTKRLALMDYVEALRRARDDGRINGALVIVDRSSLGFAQAQELRDALLDFQKKGKWAVAYMETAGEFSPGNKEYYLASACKSIWLAPPGDINLTGLRADVPFVRGTLDKLGIYPDFDHIGKYKTAMNMLTEKAMTPAHRESMESLLDSFYGQLRRGIASGRKMSEEQVRSLVDRGPFLAPQALEAKLVDALGYRDEVEDHLKKENGGRLPLIKVKRYLKSGRYYDHGARLALIYGVGGVSRGESDYNPVSGSASMGSDTVAAAIRKAREDSSIKAIVFRVNSPGGSYIASDIIWREVMLTKGVKPIVVSMSDLAGSGGYFVAMGADWIVAQPGTITASIGVLAGKLITTAFWDKVGITFDGIQRGRHATFYSTGQRYTPEEKAIFEGWLGRIYKDFVGKAAQGRHKSFAEIDAVGQGRIWSGEEALRLGLVDEVGGLPAAIKRALELAKLPPEPRVQLVLMPEGKGLLEDLMDRGDDTRTGLLSLQEGAARLLGGAALPAPERVLEMPFVPDIR